MEKIPKLDARLIQIANRVLPIAKVASVGVRVALGFVGMMVTAGMGGDTLLDVAILLMKATEISTLGVLDAIVSFSSIHEMPPFFQSYATIEEFEEMYDKYIQKNREVIKASIGAFKSIVLEGIELLGALLSLIIPDDAGAVSVAADIISALLNISDRALSNTYSLIRKVWNDLSSDQLKYLYSSVELAKLLKPLDADSAMKLATFVVGFMRVFIGSSYIYYKTNH